MDGKKWLAEQFEANRPHLRAVAYRMLGSMSEAEDAVQEVWLRLSRSDTGQVDNLTGWLTTVAARICLDMLRSGRSRREEPLDTDDLEPAAGCEEGAEHEALLADSVGLALLIVLEKLTPGERVAFVLHDMFDLPFEEIAPIVGRSPAATRQLASRARRRVKGAPPAPDISSARQRDIVKAFLAASRAGDFDGLLALLDPDVVVRADPAAVQMGSAAEFRGSAPVASFFKGRAQAAKPALIDGAAGAAVFLGGKLCIVLCVTIASGKIAAIEAIADRARLAQFTVEVFED
jgi:RNA polymerase sigma factor (sigma-70 family)